MPAVKLFATEHGQAVTVKTSAGMHDRFVLVDNDRCFQSGASFKDGAVNSPTTITQIVDAFEAVRNAYEAMWTAANTES